MEKETNLYVFGQRLKTLRKKSKLTQAKLAEKLDVSTNFIGMVERGKRNTTIDKLFKIADALDVTLAQFFETL
ncbi:helix-turn-helix transcriptional regulator [bacterium]|nr:helix-turn-helix transcriptional regulator [bacterium]